MVFWGGSVVSSTTFNRLIIAKLQYGIKSGDRGNSEIQIFLNNFPGKLSIDGVYTVLEALKEKGKLQFSQKKVIQNE